MESFFLLEKRVAWLFINGYLICNGTDIISMYKFIEYYFVISSSNKNILIYLRSKNRENTIKTTNLSSGVMCVVASCSDLY